MISDLDKAIIFSYGIGMTELQWKAAYRRKQNMQKITEKLFLEGKGRVKLILSFLSITEIIRSSTDIV